MVTFERIARRVMQRLFAATAVSILALAVAAIGCAAPAYAAKDMAIVSDPGYASAQRLVDIDHGRRLNLYCIGRGSPTVVLDAGLANWSQIWGLVQPAVARRTRACAYDRAGLGFSDPATREGSSANIVDDLHRLLHSAGIAPPYVLVGHSYGGRNVRLYADLYRDEVAGLVLDDSSIETYLWRDVAGRDDARGNRERQTHETAQARRCIEAARRRLVPGTADFAECVSAGLGGRYSEAISRVYMRLEQTPSFLEARLSETLAFDNVSPYQLLLGWRDYGDLPMIVLTRALSDTPDGLPDDARGDAVLQQHRDLAALSTRGVQRIIPHASHDIHFDKPQAVIDAILDVLAQARQSH